MEWGFESPLSHASWNAASRHFLQEMPAFCRQSRIGTVERTT